MWMKNSMDPFQLASSEASLSEYTQFSKAGIQFWIKYVAVCILGQIQQVDLLPGLYYQVYITRFKYPDLYLIYQVYITRFILPGLNIQIYI